MDSTGVETTRHAGRTALVSGAASGIGEATAVRLAREGARVVLVDQHIEPLTLVVKRIVEEGGQAVAVVGDVTRQACVDEAIAACDGRLDVLVNNAGIMDNFLPVDRVDDATWARVFDVNVTAVMRLCRGAVPLMRAAGHGAIVNVASAGGTMGATAGAAYTASKHAVVGLTKNVAALYAADGVRCNAIAPGGVATNIAKGGAAPKDAWAFDRLSRTSFPRAVRTAQPEEVAATISWLASTEASDVNGAVLPVDAGWSAF